jgi:tetratricopeptide (TPR) repeat protein
VSPSRSLLLLTPALALVLGCSKRSAPASAPAPTFVGRAACAPCHAKELELFSGSRHDLAMQPANEETVLGDFGDASFEHFGVRSSFFRREGKFCVRTDGADGQLADFEIAYTFGVYPLQQYLVGFPDGRYQALSIAWDSRAKEAGGQRWFHLYPNEPIPAGDILHWTGPAQNWNFMCAECHSTDLKKNWRVDEQRYATSWSEIDVSCEACHGPGSAHVAWAAHPTAEARDSLARGLVLDLKSEGIAWIFDPATGKSRPERPPKSRTEVEMCARCHSRRSQLFEDSVPGRALLETHKPALLEERLYHADGQQQEEVYEYGSFLQSRMYAVGVSCRNCHDPHSGRIEGTPDQVCVRCHVPERFATPAHHHHEPGGKGASCVECHMPARDYMVIDARRDHSFRVPRPDLAVELGTPDACTACHADRSASWARDAVATWYPQGRGTTPHPARALDAGRRGRPQAEQELLQLVGDTLQAPIVRASAIELLAQCLGASSLPALERALADPDGLVRSAALDALAALPPPERLRLGSALLRDPLRGVRIEAASALAGEARLLNAEQRKPFDAALAEYRAAQATNADRPEAWANLGSIAARLGERAAARRAYEEGLRVGPWFGGAWVNLADLCREEGDEAECERVLRRGLGPAADKAPLHHALGLCLARTQRLPEALVELQRALEQAPGDTELAYVYGIALSSAGRKPEAAAVLSAALGRRPADRELLFALATLQRDLGNLPLAREYARRLLEATHGDPGARTLLEELQR